MCSGSADGGQKGGTPQKIKFGTKNPQNKFSNNVFEAHHYGARMFKAVEII